jgi:autophagy-related protein 2
MLHLRVDEVVAVGRPSTPMYRVDARLLPVRLTVDQDVVQFLIDFVQLCALAEYVEEDPQEGAQDAARVQGAYSEASSSTQAAPTARRAVPQAGRAPPIFQLVSVGALLVSVDYKAKRLDVDALRRGELWELVNLLPLLEGLQIPLRGVQVRGARGFEQVMLRVVKSWSADLNRTQILRSLIGVTPIRSFANIGTGLAEVVMEPLRQYRIGGDSEHVSRTLLRGLVSFLKHVTVESIDLTERIFVGTQSALEYVNKCVSEPAQAARGGAGPSPAGAALSIEGGTDDGVIAEAWTSVERGAAEFLQPGSAREGLEQASASLVRGVRDAGQAVVVRPLLEFQRGASRERVLRSVVSGIPMCVLRPAIGATAAATTALRGVRSSVDPRRHRELVRKYKGPE